MQPADRNAATMALVLVMDSALLAVGVPVTSPVVKETFGIGKIAHPGAAGAIVGHDGAETASLT